MRLPRLRPLDVTRIQEGDGFLLLLRDMEGYTKRPMALSPVEALMAALFDGSRTSEEIAARIKGETGLKNISAGNVAHLAAKLDKNFMLESNRFKKHVRNILASFRSAESRPAHLAGLSYPAQKRLLQKQLEDYFLETGAPGRPPRNDGASPVTGLVSPHIDFPRGRVGYSWAYRELFRSGLADLYVVLGVAHCTPPTPFVLTEKDYDTPFGPAKVDLKLARALQKESPYDLRADELTHRNEHSIEFQAVYLKFVQQHQGGDFKILPLLCSSCDLHSSDPGRRTVAVLDKLEGLLRDYPGKVCLLAGVDFAHIGPCFGDEFEVDESFLRRTQEQDRRSLERLAAQDPEGFLDSVMDDGNLRKVCGVSALYAFSRMHKNLFPQANGAVTHYGHAADPTGGQVTFASMAFR